MTTARRSRLLVGTVRHRRHTPRTNAFRYRVWHLLLDVDELDELDATIPGFAHRRAGLVSIRPTDHFGPVDLPLREKVDRWVAGQGRTLPAGRLLLVAYPRVLGHVFNPVSWWYAFHPDGSLGLVIAEVRNTFGDWHAYLLDPDGRAARMHARADKVFHVSPFLPIDGLDYRFSFRPPSADASAASNERVVQHIDVRDPDGATVFDATQAEVAEALTGRSLAGVLVRRPLITLRTVALIHGQALRLLWRRTPFHRRPAPPPTGLDAVRRPARAGRDSELSDEPREVPA